MSNFLKISTATGLPTGTAMVVADLPTSIPNANLATMANNTVKANKSGISAVPSDLTLSNVSETGSSILTITNGTAAVVATSALTIQANLASAHIYVGNGSNFAADVAVSGDLTLANTGAFTIASNVVSNAKFRQSSALSVVGNSTNATANVADISGTANQVLVVNSAGTSLGFGAVNLASASAVTGTLPNGNTTATNNATASTIMSRDANANSRINSLIQGFTTTATAAGTTTLTVSSTWAQQFTGTTTQTVVLPDATTLVVGESFMIMNRSTGVVTVNANGGGLVQTMIAGSQTVVTVTSVGTSAGTWDSAYSTTGSSATLTSLGIFAGKTTITNGTTSQAVTFSGSYATTGYAITCNLLNTTDTNPDFQPITITAQSTTGFTAKWNAPVPTGNYVLSWSTILNN